MTTIKTLQKGISILGMLIFFPNLALSQTRFIHPTEHIIETAVPSRDASNVYHFVYSFRWINDTSTFSNLSNPDIDKVEFYKLGEKNSFYSKAREFNQDSYNQVEFKVPKANIDEADKIEYSLKYALNGQNYYTPRKTIIIKFPTDPNLNISVSDERLFYNDDVNAPRIKLKSNKDATVIEELVLRDGMSAESTIVAKYDNNGALINSNKFDEFVLNKSGINNLRENYSYYLHGNFSNGGLRYQLPVQTYQIVPRLNHVVKTVNNLPIEVKGESKVTAQLISTGNLSDLKAILYLNSSSTYTPKLEKKTPQEWTMTIDAQNNLAPGTYQIDLTGMGENGLPIKPTRISYIKKKIDRTSIAIDYLDKVYNVTANFDYDPANKVYLVIDGTDVEMNKFSENVYKISFSLNDQTLQALSKTIKSSTDGKKPIKISTKIDGLTDPSYVTVNAAIIDTDKLKGKSKKEIKEHLEKIGFNDKVDDLAKDIKKEIDKNGKNTDWDKVWSTALEIAPKAIPLVMMAI